MSSAFRNFISFRASIDAKKLREHFAIHFITCLSSYFKASRTCILTMFLLQYYETD